MGVVVVDLVEDEWFESTLVPDDGAVEQFTTETADSAFFERVSHEGPGTAPRARAGRTVADPFVLNWSQERPIERYRIRGWV